MQRRQGYQARFQQSIVLVNVCVRGSLETSKLEILEANFGLSSVSR